MLTSGHSIVSYERGFAIPDRLRRITHAHYLEYARRMLDLYRHGIGKTRRQLHREVEAIFARESDCEARRIDAFCKLLDDAGEFASDPRGEAAELRLRVFGLAAQYHPLVSSTEHIFERTEREVKGLIAAELGRPWPEIDAALYADKIDLQPLTAFTGYASPQELLSRYNVAQLQACLYRASRLTITARSDFASVVRYAKLARLLMEISRVDERAYRLELSGPASLLRETRRYGIQFARFIPALLACRDWQLRAELRTPWGALARLALSSEDGYRSHLSPPELFDSSVEEGLAKKWGEEEREGWRLRRNAGILHQGQATFVPDFLFRHSSGQEVYLEIVGFWTPEYLEAKRRTLARFRGHDILLAVPSRSLRAGAEPGPQVIVYKSVLKLEPILAALAVKLGPPAGPASAIDSASA